MRRHQEVPRYDMDPSGFLFWNCRSRIFNEVTARGGPPVENISARTVAMDMVWKGM